MTGLHQLAEYFDQMAASEKRSGSVAAAYLGAAEMTRATLEDVMPPLPAMQPPGFHPARLFADAEGTLSIPAKGFTTIRARSSASRFFIRGP